MTSKVNEDWLDQVMRKPLTTTTQLSSPYLKLVSVIFSGFLAAFSVVLLSVYLLKRYKASKKSKPQHNREKIISKCPIEKISNVETNNHLKSPTLFVIYSYDCESHFKVIESFIKFLNEVILLKIFIFLLDV